MYTRMWCSTDEVPWVIWSLWRDKLNFPVNRITGLHNRQRTILALQKQNAVIKMFNTIVK